MNFRLTKMKVIVAILITIIVNLYISLILNVCPALAGNSCPKWYAHTLDSVNILLSLSALIIIYLIWSLIQKRH